ncbi:MAG: hypothetical protein LQ338_002792 [Usnochroma carphineum]|nr:MAG: hypothetical protein LQ338_002792 [Usnochroma carphineum]
MVRIALAGGTGGLGRTLLDELAQDDDNTVFVLSRKSKLPFENPKNVRCLATDYNKVDDLAHLLQTNGVHTVISTVNSHTPEVQAAEKNLIRAAAQSSTVKRFIPSEWGIDYFTDDERLPLPWKIFKQQSIAELEKHPNLEYTMVYNGYFLDYFGMPDCHSYMLPEIPYIDIAACRAAIPGSGDDKVTLTYTKDVAKFVKELVRSDDKWPARSLIAGDVVTLNEVVEVAEQVRGTKFDVVRDPLEDLRNGKVTEIPAYLPLYEVFPKQFLLEMMAGFGVAMATGVFAFDESNLLNKKYPDIHTTKMRDLIRAHWSGR